MEIQDTSSRVSLGFPLSLGLLFVLLLLICGFLCCCLQWDKFQSLVPCCGFLFALIQADSPSSHHLHKPDLPFVMTKQRDVESLPVLMPGDKVPKFIAMACPCHPPKDEAITLIQMPKPAPNQ